MSAIGAFSNYGMDQVSPVNSATLTGQSYFRNLCYMIPEFKPPVASTDQMSYEKSVKKEQLERVFNGAALSIVRPTAIYALFKFKRVRTSRTTKLYLALRKLSIRAFIKRCKETQYFNWNMALPLTLAYCSKYRRTVESAAVCHRGR
jgi:hypothetical protein